MHLYVHLHVSDQRIAHFNGENLHVHIHAHIKFKFLRLDIDLTGCQNVIKLTPTCSYAESPFNLFICAHTMLKVSTEITHSDVHMKLSI